MCIKRALHSSASYALLVDSNNEKFGEKILKIFSATKHFITRKDPQHILLSIFYYLAY